MCYSFTQKFLNKPKPPRSGRSGVLFDEPNKFGRFGMRDSSDACSTSLTKSPLVFWTFQFSWTQKMRIHWVDGSKLVILYSDASSFALDNNVGMEMHDCWHLVEIQWRTRTLRLKLKLWKQTQCFQEFWCNSMSFLHVFTADWVHKNLINWRVHVRDQSMMI